MIPMQALFAARHLDDLRQEAAANRLAHLRVEANEATFGHGPSNGSRDPRKALARLVAGVSRRTADTARWLDPTVEVRRGGRPSQVPGC